MSNASTEMSESPETRTITADLIDPGRVNLIADVRPLSRKGRA
jgi:hypothetical protein